MLAERVLLYVRASVVRCIPRARLLPDRDPLELVRDFLLRDQPVLVLVQVPLHAVLGSAMCRVV